MLEQADRFRLEATKELDRRRRSELGQFFTPSSVARFMAAFFRGFGDHVRVLEPGAGVGALLAAVVAEACARVSPPKSIAATAFEIEPVLVRYLQETLSRCPAVCRRADVRFHASVSEGDFIDAGVERLDRLRAGMRASSDATRFTHAILNPPYHKLGAHSRRRQLLRRAGIETSNLYASFVALAVELLEPGGELVAIVPRSFCNGPYFRAFREFLLRETAILRVHLFESRTAAFADDDVLQENLIVHLVRGAAQGNVVVSSSIGLEGDPLSLRDVPFHQIVRPDDPELFIRLVPDPIGQQIADAFAALPSTLADLGLAVSTGKVVDFRAKKYLRQLPGPDTMPLVYPTHLAGGVVRWPKSGKKPNALIDAPGTSELWMPSGTYVLVKRFSSKEERRRVVAALFDPKLVPARKIGFENHLNVFHAGQRGLAGDVARGLLAFLNSRFVDAYVRQWSGHTQVNATDLRSLRYPTLTMLKNLGARFADHSPVERDLDEAVERMLGLTASAGPVVALDRAPTRDDLSSPLLGSLQPT